MQQRFTNLLNHIGRYLWEEKKWAIVIGIAIFINYSELQHSHDNERPYFRIRVKISQISDSTTTFRFDLINLGSDQATDFTMKSILIPNSPWNSPVKVDNFTAATEFPYNMGPQMELECKCLASKFYLVSIIKYRDPELNKSFTQDYIVISSNNQFTHHMTSKEKEELEDNVKRIVHLESNEDDD